VVLPLEQTIVWALFYSTLFWLPVRGVAAVVDRCRGRYLQLDLLEDDAAPEPVYHLGKSILPPL
jgi:hypothetical protein